MKKFIVCFIGSFLILFVLWYFSGYIRYGSDIINKHLDLSGTIAYFDDVFTFDIHDVISGFDSAINVFDEIMDNSGDNVFESAYSMFPTKV